jgi:ribonuclease D
MMKTNNHDYLKSISKEEIEKLPIQQFNGHIEVVDKPHQVDNMIKLIENEMVLGFDTETKPSFKKGRTNKVALLQLSTQNQAFLVRTSKIGLSKQITSVLENPAIAKVGLAIKDDIAGLQKLKKFRPQQFIELQSYVKDFDIQDNGLRKIAAIVLQFRILKNQQTSNWENGHLTEAQQIYAATDAWVCRQIYQKLNHYLN